jgi:hypothetical protein
VRGSDGFLGHGFARKAFFDALSAGGAADRQPWVPMPLREAQALERARVVAEWADLDREEADHKPDPRHFRAGTVPPAERNGSAVFRMLPPAFAPFVDAMDPVRRRERGNAILNKIDWDVLETIGLSPSEISERAEKAAARYAVKHPADTYNEPEHRRRRQAKIWRREMMKAARKARSYIGYAVSGVGGPKRPGRALFVTDYSVICHRAEMRQSRENMERCVIVKKDEPTVQIPMVQAHERKKAREMAKRRLLNDVLLERARSIGAKAIWITLTLEGDYHCNPTNAGHEVRKWNPAFGPDEAMQRMQELYHQTVCLLRENGLRPWGFWDAQAQQDGTVHRHVLVFVHDREMSEEEALAFADPLLSANEKAAIQADSEARVSVEARAVADGFWARFSSTPVAKRQDETKRADRGCSAYVIGDADPRYASPKGNNGRDETPDSIVKYASRYSSRLATGMGDGDEAAGAIPEDDAPATDLERHAVWARERDARLHTYIGMDSQRSPAKLWDCIWKAADRGEWPNNRRMNLAVDEMMAAQGRIDELVEARALLAGARKRVDFLAAHPDDGAAMELRKLQTDSLPDRFRGLADPERRWKEWVQHYEKALAEETPEKQAARLEDARAVVERRAEEVKSLNDDTATHAYQACIAMGLWADRDLHASERLWLRDALDVPAGDALPLPPVPLRKERENVFGETVKETVGIAAPIVTASGTAEERAAAVEALEEGEMILVTDYAGSWVFVRPSDDTTKQVLLKVDEWVITDKATAQAMVEEKCKAEEKERLAEEERRAAREDLIDVCEALYEEQADSETAWMESSCKADETPILDVFGEGLSDIPTDPRDRPCGPPREDERPPG